MSLRTLLAASLLAMTLATPAAQAGPSTGTVLTARPATEAASRSVWLEGAEFVEADARVALTYSGTPGMSFCVALATSGTASLGPRPLLGHGPSMGRTSEGDRTRCLTLNKDGHATVDAWLQSQGGLLLASIVLVTDEVHTDVVTLPQAKKRR